jgi:hypothetical protein
MGEVWRATDTRLHRNVALKILPDAFAQDPDRLARFEREARTLASLNHPNIAQVYGLEESRGDGLAAPPVQAIVMELVEGPTLADRIAEGPIPADEALPIAKQIAEALEAAHEQGISSERSWHWRYITAGALTSTSARCSSRRSASFRLRLAASPGGRSRRLSASSRSTIWACCSWSWPSWVTSAWSIAGYTC